MAIGRRPGWGEGKPQAGDPPSLYSASRRLGPLRRTGRAASASSATWPGTGRAGTLRGGGAEMSSLAGP